MIPRTRRIMGWTSVVGLYSVLGLTVIVCAGFVFNRIAVERFGLTYSMIWVRPWASWHRAEWAMSMRGVSFVIDGSSEEASELPRR